MADSVSQHLTDTAPALLDKLVTNPDLCNVVLGLLARCIVLSQERSRPFEGISIGSILASTLDNGDLVMRAKVTFSDTAKTAPAMWPPQSDFAKYVRSKAHGLGQALQRNPGLSHFFQGMVEMVEQHCAVKGLPFRFLHVKQSIISNPGDMLVLKVGCTLDV